MDNKQSDGVFINDIVKEYPEMTKIIIYSNGYFQPKNNNSTNLDKKQKNQNLNNKIRSLRRSEMSVKDYLLSNKFEYWCTFTLNCRSCRPKCDNKPCTCDIGTCDRFDTKKSTMKLRTWLRNQKQTHSPDLKYLVVPEYHKSGAIHFHALLVNFNGKVKPTGKKTINKQTIYNASGYKSGYTKFVKILNDENHLDDYKKIAVYISKYIKKDMPLITGNRRYLVSKNLIKPTSYINGVSKFKLQERIKNYKPDYINDYIEVQTHKNSLNF